MSLDGYIDDSSSERLLLSNAEDFDRVDGVRAASDAILVGANTIRRDNPRLLIRSPERSAARQARGLPPHPLKVTLTASGDLSPDLGLWHHGCGKLVYCPTGVAVQLQARLGDLAEVVALGYTIDLCAMLDDLARRGVGRLMVEGGSTILTGFLLDGLADELQVAIAPFLVGDPTAPRLVGPGRFPYDAGHRLELAEATPIGDVALLRFVVPEAREATAEPSP
jgi:riboflavin-specific deaminase-like protein